MQTGQPYAYAGDDPLNSSDPLGLCDTSNQTCVTVMFAAWVVSTDELQQGIGESLALNQQWGYVVAGEYLVNHPVYLSQDNLKTEK
jgi:hypothetical protein